VPLATNIATADILMGSEVLWEKARVRASARHRSRQVKAGLASETSGLPGGD
jgi:methylglyoxal synthase